MGQMIEKCARAMQASKAWPAVFDAGTAEVLAAAVIDALMEPTEAMLEAAIAPYRDKNSAEFTDIMREAVAGYFRAMLSKAKSE